ncbi:class II fructose-bisphosphate aldolase [Clostridium tyrobutyricum]|uniref:class II fructose-bisphosphate aldolase n=1 Tax=Clostridium tyrobutyricum TaxID=1519 RepID=UPI00073DA940|nr:class II fructose-bisphosphate aldolase [Clostridium tyrobutyricum]
MYVSMKYILDDANKNNYGVIAANVINLELARGVINAAVEENAPIIINIGQGQMHKHASPDIMCDMIKTLAIKTHVPVALNLDHGSDFNRITDAFRNGFSSIMIDASQYPYDENVNITKKVVKLAHSQGVTVEAELGHVGQANTFDNKNKTLYTDPAEAVKFLKDTKADALAVAVGTAHGSYPKDLKPELNFNIISDIKKYTKIPLVLHGGSGSGSENIKNAVKCGINKINVCTDTFNSCRNFLKERLMENPEIDFLSLMIELENAAKETIRSYIKISGSCNKANNFSYYEY